MKKFLAILLTVLMVMSMSVAFADTWSTTGTSYGFKKTYELAGVTGVSPAETFRFENIKFVSVDNAGVGVTTDWCNENLPEFGNVVYEKGAAGSDNKTADISLTLPAYTEVGEYHYTFNEVNNNVAGVTYRSGNMELVVTVYMDGESKKLEAVVHCETSGGKVQEFTNTYTAGELTVSKTVAGNMGDKVRDFEITVNFTSDKEVKSDVAYGDSTLSWKKNETTGKYEAVAVIEIGHGDSVKFTNIPSGVSYSVTETDSSAVAAGDAAAEYKVKYDNQTGTITNTAVTATVTNTKDGDIDTGLTLDNLPYIMIMAFVVIAAVSMMKRRAYNA